jgi:hypothetical protein
MRHTTFLFGIALLLSAIAVSCVSGPEQGSMGVHFVNVALVDGKPEAKAPQALIYEVCGGRARLLGVEYTIPVDAWHPTAGESPVPVLPAFYERHRVSSDAR